MVVQEGSNESLRQLDFSSSWLHVSLQNNTFHPHSLLSFILVHCLDPQLKAEVEKVSGPERLHTSDQEYSALNDASLQQFHNGILIGPRRHSSGTWCQSFLFLALSFCGCPSCHTFTGFPLSLSAPFYFWNYLNYLLHLRGLFLTPRLLRRSSYFPLGWMRKRYIRGKQGRTRNMFSVQSTSTECALVDPLAILGRGQWEAALCEQWQLQSIIHTGHLHSVMHTHLLRGESKDRKQQRVTQTPLSTWFCFPLFVSGGEKRKKNTMKPPNLHTVQDYANTGNDKKMLSNNLNE